MGTCVSHALDGCIERGDVECVALGLRMAAEIVRDTHWKNIKMGQRLSGFDVYNRIIEKAKQFEDGMK
jgi:hypothetical protein